MALATTVLAATAATNPFFDYKNWKTPHGTYPFNEIHAEHYMPAFEEAFKQGLKDIDDIVNNPAAPTFANTIEAYEKSGEMLTIVAGCFYNLTSAETNDTLQQIEMELSPKMSEYSSAIRLNEGLFQRIKTVYDQRGKLKLNKAQYKLLEDIYESFANNGANLSSEDKQTYRELTAKLSKLTLQYGQNVLKATNAWTMLITDEALLAGLNDDTKAMLRSNAEKKGLEGYLLNLKPTTTIPVMQDLDNRDIRRELYMANVGKCVGGEFDNTGIIVEIVNTRLALANLFDKKTYAEKSLYKTMAETPEKVFSLLDQLRDAYMPAAREEVKELEDYAHAHGFYAAHIQPWDFSYYSKKLKQEKYAISDDDLRPYFELENVKKGVFGLAEKLYGLKFKENKNIQVYNPEVTAYEVYDEKGKFLAVYYADFHPRDGKRGGAWMNDFQPQYMDASLMTRFVRSFMSLVMVCMACLRAASMQLKVVQTFRVTLWNCRVSSTRTSSTRKNSLTLSPNTTRPERLCRRNCWTRCTLRRPTTLLMHACASLVSVTSTWLGIPWRNRLRSTTPLER